MTVTLFYFTGTGNTLTITRDLAQGMEHNGEVLIEPIVKYRNHRKVVVDTDVVGIIFPSYYLDAPDVVKQFVKKLRSSREQYIFAIVNCGGDAGNSLSTIKSLLARNKLNLAAGYTVFMPENSILYYSKPERQEKMFKKEKLAVEEILVNTKNKIKSVQEIDGKTKSQAAFRDSQSINPAFKTWVHTRVLKLGLRVYFRHMNKKVDPGICNQCGVCVEVCPVNNISLKSGKVKWGNACVDCFGCIQWCSRKAVSYGKINLEDKPGYHHPDVTWKDIKAQKKMS